MINSLKNKDNSLDLTLLVEATGKRLRDRFSSHQP